MAKIQPGLHTRRVKINGTYKTQVVHTKPKPNKPSKPKKK